MKRKGKSERRELPDRIEIEENILYIKSLVFTLSEAVSAIEENSGLSYSTLYVFFLLQLQIEELEKRLLGN